MAGTFTFDLDLLTAEFEVEAGPYAIWVEWKRDNVMTADEVVRDVERRIAELEATAEEVGDEVEEYTETAYGKVYVNVEAVNAEARKALLEALRTALEAAERLWHSMDRVAGFWV